MAHTHWKILSEQSSSPSLQGGLNPFIATLLANRGIQGELQCDAFLKADQRLIIDPFSLPDMHQAVNRIYKALFSGEKIAVYGDFDADGITATALLVQGLTELGGNVIPYIPHRQYEGYGLKVATLEKLHKHGISLVITVDTGITAFDEVARANKMGLDVLITDHHVPLEELPAARIIVDPKREDSQCPFTEFAGVGVAFKLLQALLADKNRQDLIASSIELVTLGTITDMSPLLSENRYLVKTGLPLLGQSSRVGLQELMKCANIETSKLNTESISYQIGPRLNSAGRLDDASTSYELLVTKDRHQARTLAIQLDEKNKQRQRLVTETMEKARKQIIKDGTDRPLLMAADSDYPAGVIGLVAGRLSEEFYRPVILFKIGEETARGSGRSIQEFDLMAALKSCHNILTKYGGHARAAGCNVLTRDLPQLQKKLRLLAEEQLAGLDLRPHINIDAEVNLSLFASGFYNEMKMLEPYGIGNPSPVFLSRNVEVVEQKLIGNQNDHIRLKLRQDDIVWDSVGFRMGNYSSDLSGNIDIVYSVEVDRFNGNGQLRLNLLDFSRHQ